MVDGDDGIRACCARMKALSSASRATAALLPLLLLFFTASLRDGDVLLAC